MAGRMRWCGSGLGGHRIRPRGGESLGTPPPRTCYETNGAEFTLNSSRLRTLG
jgi:hypothetical protein